MRIELKKIAVEGLVNEYKRRVPHYAASFQLQIHAP